MNLVLEIDPLLLFYYYPIVIRLCRSISISVSSDMGMGMEKNTKPVSKNGNGNKPLEMRGSGTKKSFPLNIYCIVHKDV